ncbi:MAG: hypothetical protein WCP95_03795 [Actinomycetes bacterium]
MSTRSLIASISSVFVIAATLVLAVPAMASSSDADHDGMSNRWEVRYHLDARRPNALADADHDGLANLAEFRLGTNPRDKDSDNDGTFDGLEDFDDDGIDNEDECLVGGFSADGEDDEDCFVGGSSLGGDDD